MYIPQKTFSPLVEKHELGHTDTNHSVEEKLPWCSGGGKMEKGNQYLKRRLRFSLKYTNKSISKQTNKQ